MTTNVQTQAAQTAQTRKKMITEVFCEGIGKGWNISVKFMTPNIIMAFVLIKFLNHSGLMKILGDVFAPVMSLFGLPGEAAAAIIGAWLSIGGGVGIPPLYGLCRRPLDPALARIKVQNVPQESVRPIAVRNTAETHDADLRGTVIRLHLCGSKRISLTID